MGEATQRGLAGANALFAQVALAGPRPFNASLGAKSWLNPLRLVYFTQEVRRRREFLRRYGWAVPTPEALSAIRRFVDYRKVLEVGAGTGLWASLLDAYGVSVTPTDDYSWVGPGEDEAGRGLPSGFSVDAGKFYPVERLEAEAAVLTHQDHEALMICWPPPQKSMAFEATRAFGGDQLIFIGELSDTSGDVAFRNLLGLHWKREAVIQIPTWVTIHDAVHLFVRDEQVWAASGGDRPPNPHMKSG